MEDISVDIGFRNSLFKCVFQPLPAMYLPDKWMILCNLTFPSLNHFKEVTIIAAAFHGVVMKMKKVNKQKSY